MCPMEANNTELYQEDFRISSAYFLIYFEVKKTVRNKFILWQLWKNNFFILI